MKMVAFISICAIMLSGCGSITQERIEFAYSRCPVLKQYSREEMLKAAQEIKTLPSESQIADMMADYSKLRDACRLAEKTLKKQR